MRNPAGGAERRSASRLRERSWVTRLVRRAIRIVSRERQRTVIRRKKAVSWALAEIARYPQHRDPAIHALPGPLLVSLTSYPPRFGTLHRSLKSLLDQTVRPDLMILWVAEADAALLPASVLDLCCERFVIRTCADLGSYKKILPAQATFPDHFIVTADDDVFYPPTWLETLTAAYDPNEPSIVCFRAHRIAYTRTLQLAPYRRWQREVRNARSKRPRTDLMPTGNGGILYPPGALPPQTHDLALIARLSPTCDDSWLYFMWRQAGWRARRAPHDLAFAEWPDAQEQALCKRHRGGPKDAILQGLAAHFGVP